MLDSRKAEIIRLCFFKGMTIEEAAEKLDVSAKTAQNAKKKALEDLTELFALTAASLWLAAVPAQMQYTKEGVFYCYLNAKNLLQLD